MGFSLILIGYFAVYLMSLHTFGYVFHIGGFLFVLIGAAKLGQYSRGAKPLFITSLCMMALSALNGGIIIWNNFGNLAESFPAISRLPEISNHIFTYAAFFFNAALLYSLRTIAIETGTFSIAGNAIRNFIFICFYYFIRTAGLVISFFEISNSYVTITINILMILSNIFFVALNLMIIFTCYAKICDADDKDMPEKPKKFNVFWFMDKKNTNGKGKKL